MKEIFDILLVSAKIAGLVFVILITFYLGVIIIKKGIGRAAKSQTTEGVKTAHNFTTFVIGFAFCTVLSLVAFVIFSYPVYWPLIAGIWAYFGILGITKKIEIGWKAVPTFLGKRVRWYPILPEGYNWFLPRPIGGIKEVDCRVKTRGDITSTEVLSKDNILVRFSVSIQTMILDPYLSLSVDDPDKAVDELTDRTLRWEANKKVATDLPSEKEALSNLIENEADKISEKWGMDVQQVMVKEVRLPKDMEEAFANKQTEIAQKDAETVEFNHVLTMLGSGDLEEGKKAWNEMKPQERAKIMQAERGKRIVVTVDGNAGDFTKGSVAAEAMRSRGGKK